MTGTMWIDDADTPALYQWPLRVIGAELDSLHARRVTIFETRGGFTIRYQRDDGSAFGTLQWNAEELLETRADRAGLRKAPRDSDAHGRYEDTLRMLGFELEQSRAQSILLDETDDGFAVMYQQILPQESFMPRKRMFMLGWDGERTALELARARRRQTRSALRKLFGQ